MTKQFIVDLYNKIDNTLLSLYTNNFNNLAPKMCQMLDPREVQMQKLEKGDQKRNVGRCASFYSQEHGHTWTVFYN